MDPKVTVSTSSEWQSPVDAQLEMEVWEPAFDRWMRMADDLLRDWPKHNVGQQCDRLSPHA